MFSFVIATNGIVSMWLLGFDDWRRRAGFALALANQFIWIGYAVWTAQYGFVLGAVVYGSVCVRNLWRLRRSVPSVARPEGPRGAARD